MDPRSSRLQTRSEYADQSDVHCGAVRDRFLPGESPVSALEKRPLGEEEVAQTRRALEAVWRPRPGVKGWFSNTLHTTIGRRYIVTAFIFFLFGGVEAFLMRLQLAKPENT